MEIVVGGHYRNRCDNPLSPWDGAEIVVTDIFTTENSAASFLIGQDVFYFDVVDKSLPKFDVDDREFPEHLAWKGAAFRHHITPLED